MWMKSADAAFFDSRRVVSFAAAESATPDKWAIWASLTDPVIRTAADGSVELTLLVELPSGPFDDVDEAQRAVAHLAGNLGALDPGTLPVRVETLEKAETDRLDRLDKDRRRGGRALNVERGRPRG